MRKMSVMMCFMALSGFLGAHYAWGQTTNEMDSLLNQVEEFSTKRGTDTHRTAEDFRKAEKRLSEKRNTEKVRLIKESKRSDKGWEYRCAIMRVMAPVQDDSVSEALMDNLKEANSKLRGCAAKQLGEHKGQRVVEVLINSLADKDSFVRAHSAHSLGRIKNSKAIDSLKKHTRDTDQITAINAVWALGEIGDSSLGEYLNGLMSDSDETIKINIVVALAKMKSDKKVDYLRKISKSESEPAAVRDLAREIVQKLEKGLKPW